MRARAWAGSVVLGLLVNAAADLRLGGFCLGAVVDFGDGSDIPLSYLYLGGRLGGYIYVNPHLHLQPYAGLGYDWWYLTGSSAEEGLDSLRVDTGLRFIIRPVGRFLILVGPEIRGHYSGEGDVYTFQLAVGVGVGLGG